VVARHPFFLPVIFLGTASGFWALQKNGAETALRLVRYFNTNAEFWLNLQNFFDLEVTTSSGKISR
jgi:hypothetical protein